MTNSYSTIQARAEGFYKEKGSKFLSFAFPVSSEEEIKECQDLLRKEYYDARHHCYAYVLGPHYEHFRANDDGEPNHSAGDPILGQIKSRALTNVLIVVVRYFGGTKLGVGGLINAYRTAADAALINARSIKIDITNCYVIHYNYEATNEVMRVVSDFELEILEQSYAASCRLKVNVKLDLKDQFITRMQLLQDLGNEIKMDQLSS